jgi:C4-dicarboxylate-specific signal transduction histidine kinase
VQPPHPFGRLCSRVVETGRQREEAQRLASVGQMAAGLAHGLNTSLANIVGYAQ